MFSEARRAEEAGKWSEALLKLKAVASVKMTPQVRFHLGLCQEHTGHLVEALNSFEVARAEAADQGVAAVVDEARDHAASVRGRVPKLLIVLPAGADAKVEVDGQVISSGLLARALPFDPGRHTIAASSPGQAFSREVTISEKEEKRIEVAFTSVPLAAAPKVAPAAAPPPPSSASTSSPGASANASDSGHASGGSSTLGWIAVGTGGLALAGSAITAIMRLRLDQDHRQRVPQSSRLLADPRKFAGQGTHLRLARGGARGGRRRAARYRHRARSYVGLELIDHDRHGGISVGRLEWRRSPRGDVMVTTSTKRRARQCDLRRVRGLSPRILWCPFAHVQRRRSESECRCRRRFGSRIGIMDAAPDVPLGCANLKLDGVETDIDCGGKSCAGCATGLKCKEDADCVSAYCNDGVCARASCVDKVKNLNETDIDCGGTDCPPCAVGKNCKAFGDCQQQSCTAGKCQPQTCDDHFQGPGETDIDCGGPNCAPCDIGKKCLALGDCATSVCSVDSLCAAPSCKDGVQNGVESGKDCGGTDCPKCPDGLGCAVGTDCASGTCTDHVCEMVSCNDKILNGTESDIDCGGTCTTKCSAKAICHADSDCMSGNCATTCQACPRGMVNVPVPASTTGTYCIDATEVTVTAYSAFLASNPSTMTLPASCSSKTSFVPGTPLDTAIVGTIRSRRSIGVTRGGTARPQANTSAGASAGATRSPIPKPTTRKRASGTAPARRGGAQTYPYPGQYVSGRCVDRQVQNCEGSRR